MHKLPLDIVEQSCLTDKINMHHTHYYGNIGVAKTITDLLKKGYIISVPFISEYSKYDIIAEKDGVCFRIQCKFSSNGKFEARKYKKSDFDYYSIYLSKIDKIVYVPFLDKNIRIAQEVPNAGNKFYWWEDFLNFPNDISLINKRKHTDFNKKITRTNSISEETKIKLRKVKERPSKEELYDLVWKLPTSEIAKKFKVSDTAISKWCKVYDINKPPRGYWMKINSKNNKE